MQIKTFCGNQIQIGNGNLQAGSSQLFLEQLNLPTVHPFCGEEGYNSTNDLSPLQSSHYFDSISSSALSFKGSAVEIASYGGLWVRFIAPVASSLLLLSLVLTRKSQQAKHTHTILQLVICCASTVLSFVMMFDESYKLDFGPWLGIFFLSIAVVAGCYCTQPSKARMVQVVSLAAFVGYGLSLISVPALNFGFHPSSPSHLNEGLYYDGVKNPFIQKLVDNWPIEERQYGFLNGATPWTVTGDSRTAMPFLLNHQQKPAWTRVWQQMEDGEVVALDILFPDTGHNTSNPIYLLLPGMVGGSNSGYIEDLAERQTAKGNTVVTMVSRGLMDLPIAGSNGYHLARTSDIQEVADRLHGIMDNKNQMLVGVGFSMGGNILGNYVARAGQRVSLDTAIIVSAALDKRIATKDQRAAELWLTALAKDFRHYLLDGKLGSRLAQRLNMDQAKSVFMATQANEMADILAAYYGFDDRDHYYAESSVLGDVTEDDYAMGSLPDSARIHNIAIPTLVVHALDDPVLIADSVVSSEGIMHPDNLVKSGKGNLMILLTKQGGHVGWPMGWNPSDNKWKWTSDVVSSFVEVTIKAVQNPTTTEKSKSSDSMNPREETGDSLVRSGASASTVNFVEAPVSAVGMALIVAFSLVLFQKYWSWRRNPFRLENPGPSKEVSFLLGNVSEALSYAKPSEGSIKWLMDARINEPGNATPLLVFSEVLGEINTIIVDPDVVKQVLTSPVASDSSLYKKNWTFLGRFLGEGLVTLDGPQWHRHRRILNPCFGPKLIKDFVNHSVPSLTQDLVSIWKTFEGNDQVINVQNHFSALMVDAIGKFGFSGTMGALASLSTDSQGQLPPVADAILQFAEVPSIVSLLLHVLKLSFLEKWLRPNFVKARSVMKQTIDKEILTVRSNIENGFTASDSKSMLPVMLQAKDTEHSEGTTAKPKYLNNKELRDEIQTLITAGFETTKTLLTWSIAELCKNKDMQSRLFEEIFAEFGGDNRQINSDTVEKLPYLAAFIKEVLRMYPSFPIISRVATKDVELKGRTVPAGTRNYIFMDLLHRDPDHWIKPNEFRPERWTNGETDNLHKFSYLPFGAGGRSCIGQRLALLEAKIVLATLVQTFEMELAPHLQKTGVNVVGLLLTPKEGVDICVKQRSHMKA